MDQAAEHWESVYGSRALDELSWFQASPAVSLRLLQQAAPQTGSVIDVGAGASTLADLLVEAGWADVTVLDVSASALSAVRARLGPRADRVSFVAADLLSWQPRRSYDVWHDRAVFHFLVAPADQARYVALAGRAVATGGALVLGSFAADGPTRCSGLPITRYDPETLADAFAPAFRLEHAEREEHVTPGGSIQPFSWVVLRRR
ncbi:MAG TPA: class I SAM-dependent methyltransferase [Mycobacteriales bacterium]|nr:class I SAM-dependent methyltransferase [Mycobacteriales bacterium]